MECFIANPADISEFELMLTGDEAHHALRSLRLRIGDELMATDLQGTCYRCQLVESLEKGSAALCRILVRLPEYGEPTRRVRLIQGMIHQPARWEFLLEKAVELGVSEIQPVSTDRTEREHFKAERSERILRAAVKQTKRARIPTIRLRHSDDRRADDGQSDTRQPAISASRKAPSGELSTLGEALSEAVHDNSTLFLLHEGVPPEFRLHEQAKLLGPSDRIAIVIGPEGGFNEEEVQMAHAHGARLVSLGTRRLRAETAALAALAIVIDR